MTRNLDLFNCQCIHIINTFKTQFGWLWEVILTTITFPAFCTKIIPWTLERWLHYRGNIFTLVSCINDKFYWDKKKSLLYDSFLKRKKLRFGYWYFTCIFSVLTKYCHLSRIDSEMECCSILGINIVWERAMKIWKFEYMLVIHFESFFGPEVKLSVFHVFISIN